jgi:hypothetical protein
METEREPLEDKSQIAGPSGIGGIADGVRNLVAETTAGPKKKEAVAEGEKEPCKPCGEGKTDEEILGEVPKTRFFIVDKETGREIPAVFKSEGKDYTPDSVDKILTWTGLGIHYNKRAEQIKGYEEFVKMLLKAKEEGRLVIKDEEITSSRSKKEDVEEPTSEDDEILTDPALLAERKKRTVLEGEMKELRKTVDSLKSFVINAKTSEMKKEIETEIDQFSKQYPLGKKRANQVWKNLAEVDEDGKPVYTVEQAMKKVHEESIVELKEWVKEHPEFVEEDKIKKEAVVEYLKDKEEKEKAPVSAPSGVPAGTRGSPKDEIKGIADIPLKIKQLLDSSKAAGKKL